MNIFIHTSIFVALAITTGAAATPQEIGNQLIEKYGDAVVTVQAVAEVRGRERELESLGTMIDNAGTVVVAHSRFTSNELSKVKLLLADGSEVAAKVVLTDPDLDIAFIQPDLEALDGEEFEFTSLALNDKLVELQAADQVIILSREGEGFRRQSSLILGSVETVLDAPRRYYRTNRRPPGTPAFSVDGAFVGIFARRVQGDRAHHRVILPCPAILKATENLPNKVLLNIPDLKERTDDPLKAVAQNLLDSYGESIVIIEATGDIVISFGEQSQTITQTFDGPSVVVNEQGLAVGPNFSNSITQQITSQVRNQLGGAVEVNVVFEFKKLKMKLSDGTEIPAKLLFLDNDLNLCFIEPDFESEDAEEDIDEDLTFTPVNFTDDVEASVFEEVLMISRYGQDLDRALFVSQGRVSSIQRKPRLLYLTDVPNVSAAVFNKDAKLVGFMAFNKGSQGTVLLPVKTVRKSVEQFNADNAID